MNLGSDRPVAIVSPPGETIRLFVVEKSGRVIVSCSTVQHERILAEAK